MSSTASSRASSPTPASPTKGTATVRGKKTGHTNAAPSALSKAPVDQRALDISSLNLDTESVDSPVDEPPPKMSLAREKVLEEARKAIDEKKKAVSIVVIGEYGELKMRCA